MERGASNRSLMPGRRFEGSFLVTGHPDEVFKILTSVTAQFAQRPIFGYAVNTDGFRISVARRFLPAYYAVAGLGMMPLIGAGILILLMRNSEELIVTLTPEPGDVGSQVKISGTERGFFVSSGNLSQRIDGLSRQIERALRATWPVAKQ